jgi:hypothetical protein
MTYILNGANKQFGKFGGGSMEDVVFLVGLAQVSVTIVGFSGLITVFGPSVRSLASRRSAMRVMILHAAGGTLFSILPLPFIRSQLPPEYTWSICSLLFAWASAHMAASLILDVRRRMRSGEFFYGPTAIPISLAMIIITVVMVLNGIGLFFERSFTPYLACLSIYIAGANWSFGRMVYMSLLGKYDVATSGKSREKGQPETATISNTAETGSILEPK